jgi:hypothetical protein
MKVSGRLQSSAEPVLCPRGLLYDCFDIAEQNELKFKQEASEVLHLDHSMLDAETWTLWKVDQNT